jgi:hypothetical protein
MFLKKNLPISNKIFGKVAKSNPGFNVDSTVETQRNEKMTA